MKIFKRVILIVLGILLVFECYLIFSFLQGYESTKHDMPNQNKQLPLMEKKPLIKMI